MSVTTGVVDLRSDTVTRPTPEMRRAMADADVGVRVAALREELVATYAGQTVLLVSHVTPPRPR